MNIEQMLPSLINVLTINPCSGGDPKEGVSGGLHRNVKAIYRLTHSHSLKKRARHPRGGRSRKTFSDNVTSDHIDWTELWISSKN